MPIPILLLVILVGLLLLGGLFALLRAYFAHLYSKRMAAFQGDLIDKHFQEVQNIYRQMRGWRHDYHNHIQAMKAYRLLGEDDRLDAYLDSLDKDLQSVDTLVKSGNVMVDAIIGSKLSLARSREIRVDAKATVPVALAIPDIDLCVIIGNLLDNAIEATQAVEDAQARYIRLYIDVKKGTQLYMAFTNSAGKAPARADRFRTTKGEGHGLGLYRVDRLVKKYGGYLSRAQEDGAFTTEVLLPL